VDVEDFLRDDISIEADSSEGNPIDDFCWFVCLYFQSPDGESGDKRIDEECEIREGDSSDHRIGMDDDI
jgi:hypothetical protein